MWLHYGYWLPHIIFFITQKHKTITSSSIDLAGIVGCYLSQNLKIYVAWVFFFNYTLIMLQAVSLNLTSTISTNNVLIYTCKLKVKFKGTSYFHSILLHAVHFIVS